MVLDAEARKIIRKWTRRQGYVYLRPLDYRFLNPSTDFQVHWAVTVEFRGMEWKQYRGEGLNLSEVVKELGERVVLPKPKAPPGQDLPRPTKISKVLVKKVAPPTKKAKKGKKKRVLSV